MSSAHHEIADLRRKLEEEKAKTEKLRDTLRRILEAVGTHLLTAEQLEELRILVRKI